MIEAPDESQDFFLLNGVGERVMLEFGISELIMKVQKENYDTLFFLNKSAIPLSWIFETTWELLFPDQKMPQIKFITPPNGSDYENIKSFLDSMSSLSRQDAHELVGQQFGSLFGDIGGKVCLVDEMSHSGDSYRAIEDLIQSRNPGTTTDTFDAMQSWPSWRKAWAERPKDGEELVGLRKRTVEDVSEAVRASIRDGIDFDWLSKDASPLIAVENPTKKTHQLKDDTKKLAVSTKDHFGQVQASISSCEEFTEGGDLHNKIQEFLRGLQLKFEIHGKDIVLDNDDLLEKLRSQTLDIQDALRIYNLIRSWRLELKDYAHFQYEQSGVGGLIDPDEIEAIKELSRFIENSFH